MNTYRIRSWLFTPAIKEKFFEKILNLGGEEKPDVIIFDLEDSVHPDFKVGARENLRKYLYEDRKYRKGFFSKYLVSIRINSYRTEPFREDLKLVSQIKPDFLMMSKVESPGEMRFVRKKSKVSQLFVIVETIKGFEDRESIMKDIGFNDALVLGYEDLSAELMIERPENLNSTNPLTDILLKSIISARKNDIIMTDAVSRKYGTPDNLKELEKECIFTAGLGLSSKVAIHPSQVPIINSIFDKRLLLENAKKNMGKFMELKDGSSVIVGENKDMMDMPSYRMYSKILRLWDGVSR